MTSVVLDLETSHPDPTQARVIEIAYAVVDNETFHVLRVFDSLVFHDELDIEKSSAEIHNITRDMCLADGRSPGAIVDLICTDWADVDTIVAHGVDTDVEVLGMMFVDVLGYWPFAHCRLVCTKELGTVVHWIPRGRDGYKWPSLVELWRATGGVGDVSNHHRAARDVELCLDCLNAIRLLVAV